MVTMMVMVMVMYIWFLQCYKGGYGNCFHGNGGAAANSTAADSYSVSDYAPGSASVDYSSMRSHVQAGLVRVPLDYQVKTVSMQ